jgi:hypothetical protein
MLAGQRRGEEHEILEGARSTQAALEALVDLDPHVPVDAPSRRKKLLFGHGEAGEHWPHIDCQPFECRLKQAHTAGAHDVRIGENRAKGAQGDQFALSGHHHGAESRRKKRMGKRGGHDLVGAARGLNAWSILVNRSPCPKVNLGVKTAPLCFS